MAFMIYLFIGIYAFKIERKSMINQLFLAFCLSMSIWSLAYAFVYVTVEEQHIWMKISAIGWCTFSSFILHLVLLFTENKRKKNTLIKILIYTPGVLFFYISVFLYRKDAVPSKFIVDFFNYGDFIYHFSFLLISMILVTLWGIKSKNNRKRKQAIIIVVSSFIPYILNLLTQTILPVFGINILPPMGHIYSLFMIIGVFYAMIKFRLFAITPKLLVEELLQEMMDIVILVSTEGKIIRMNNYTEGLLGYPIKELQDEYLGVIMQEEVVAEICKLSYNTEIHRLSEVYCTKKDGTSIPISLSCSPIIDPNMKDIIGFVIVGQDISLVKQLENEIAERKQAEEQILYLAYRDSLTGLPNRKYFYEMLNKAIENANSTGEGFAVFFLDLDDLKNINDGFGHEMGDVFLCEVGNRTMTYMTGTDIVARIGGDEFIFLISGICNNEEAQIAADNILKSINKPMNMNGMTFNMNASIGFSIFPKDGNDAGLLVKKADSQMYMAKREKKQQAICS
jgi:diguanylate cyclase (GGDEF)-like protein/PAS domain S-box-containing protein